MCINPKWYRPTDTLAVHNKGFPASSTECHKSVKPYFNYHDELPVVDALMLKGNRIVVPTKLRSSCLAMLHIAHMGMKKTLLWARQSIFWRGITKDITQLISSYSACIKHASRNSSEPLINDIAATKPWQALSFDNFEWQGQKYLIILYHFSRFVIVKKLWQVRFPHYNLSYVRSVCRTWNT